MLYLLLRWGKVSAAPFGSALILPISWIYTKLMGYRCTHTPSLAVHSLTTCAGRYEGLTMATKIAILNANYMKAKLERHYPVMYTGNKGTCAHEFILDLNPFHDVVTAGDVCKRLQAFLTLHRLLFLFFVLTYSLQKTHAWLFVCGAAGLWLPRADELLPQGLLRTHSPNRPQRRCLFGFIADGLS